MLQLISGPRLLERGNSVDGKGRKGGCRGKWKGQSLPAPNRMNVTFSNTYPCDQIERMWRSVE
jgi:hypothetical protein